MVSRFPVHVTGGLLAASGQSFGVGDPVGLFRKFEFDLRRVIDPSIDDALGYDVMNAALDAWHMVDWLVAWAVIKEDLREFLVSHLQLEKWTKQLFIERLKLLCPRIALCQTVCNASKHARIEADRPGYNPGLVTRSLGGNSFTFVGAQRFDLKRPVNTSWTIEDGDAWISADAVLIDVFHFWRDLLVAADLIDIPDGGSDHCHGLLWLMQRHGV